MSVVNTDLLYVLTVNVKSKSIKYNSSEERTKPVYN